MTMYAVTAQVYTQSGPWSGSRSLPTFYLDSNVQGIVNAKHAAEIAQDLIRTCGAPHGFHVTVTGPDDTAHLEGPRAVARKA